MPSGKYLESKSYVTRGLLMLLAGCALLLLHKLPIPGIIGSAGVLAGALTILLGNGFIIFGLLVFADSRTK